MPGSTVYGARFYCTKTMQPCTVQPCAVYRHNMLTLEQVVPLPLQGQIQQSDIWQCQQRLEKGRRYFIFAPSGSGKTTFQHLLYGMRKDYTGTARIEGQLSEKEVSTQGKDLQQLRLDQWAYIRQCRLSVVFQDLRLFPALSAMENIVLKNQLTQFKTTDAIRAMAAQLGVEQLLDKKCGELSYGQRQRMAIVRALCQPFELLLLDEPFSHLDKENIRKACGLIAQECAAQGAGYALASLGDKYELEYDLCWNL